MRDEPLLLPQAAANASDRMFGFTIDGSRWRFTLAQLLEPGALKAATYLHAAPAPGLLGLIIGTDGWLWARHVSNTPLGRMVLEPMAAAPPVREDDGPVAFARGRRSAA